jgi:hypothetical protein
MDLAAVAACSHQAAFGAPLSRAVLKQMNILNVDQLYAFRTAFWAASRFIYLLEMVFETRDVLEKTHGLCSIRQGDYEQIHLLTPTPSANASTLSEPAPPSTRRVHLILIVKYNGELPSD